MKHSFSRCPYTTIGGLLVFLGCACLVLFHLTEAVNFLADHFDNHSHHLLAALGFALLGLGGLTIGIHAITDERKP